MEKKKLLIFHPALAPYRIDQFNQLAVKFDLTIVFIFDNVWNHRFDQDALLSQLKCKYTYLLKGLRYKGRVFRFGMLRTINEIKPDIILGYEYSFTTQYLILLKRLGLIKQKIGISTDDSLDICINVRSGIRKHARASAIKWLDYLVVLSEPISRFYQEHFGVAANNIIVSPILQNPDRIREDKKQLADTASIYSTRYMLHDKKVLLFIGRFIKEKGLSSFIENISPVIRKYNDIRIVIVGDGEEKGKIQSTIERLKLTSQVILPGRFEGNALYAWYLCGSGFVLPSIYEPFGAVVNEALIFGLPVCCSKVAGSVCLLEPDKDKIFDPSDSYDTRQAMEQFYQQIQPLTRIQIKPIREKVNFTESFSDWELLTGS